MRASLLWLISTAVLSAGCAEAISSDGSDAPLLKEVRRAPKLRRTLLPMLSVPVEFAPCPAQTHTGQGLRCGLGPPEIGAKWAVVGGRISTAVEAGADPDALHAAAVLDLLTGAAGNTLDRSISYLEMSTRIAPNPDRFVDLSGGYLARAGRDDDARSVVAALDAAARATQIDSTNAAARFNMALALRELGLFGAARAELQRFATIDRGSPWADEALRYIPGLTIDTVVAPSDTTITPDSIAAFARAHSNEARSFAWDRLAAWSRAYSIGDTEGAERHLRLAEAAGHSIEQHHIDPSIGDAARAVRKASVQEKAKLAAAHRTYVESQANGRANRSEDADKGFRAVQGIAAISPSLAAWAAYDAANTQIALKNSKGAESALRRLLDSPAAERYPALTARTEWALGVVLLRDRRYAEATVAIARSRDTYRKLGEREYEASMTGLIGEAANLGGDARTAYAKFTEALRLLRNYPLSFWRHNTLLVLSRAAATDGYVAAAAVIDAEDDAASRAAGRVWSLVESQLTRARNARSIGDSVSGRLAVVEGRRLAAQLLAGNFRRQLQMDLAVEGADIGVDAHSYALATLDTAVAYFDSIANYSKQLSALAARASLSIRSGNIGRADADLDRALLIYEERRGGVHDATQRSLLTQQARRVVDALTMLRISRGDVRGALSARERARESGPPVTTTESGGLIIELALVDDTLVAFTSRGSDVHVTTSVGEGASLRSDIDVVNLALERGATESAWRLGLERLYDRIITPIESQLLSADSVVTIITDGALSSVPFAALRNAEDGSYLVERYALRLTRSLRQAAERRQVISAEPRALLVAEPKLDRRAFPGLSALRGAGPEVDSIAMILRRSLVLRGAAVDTTRLKAEMGTAEIFHFAGHAIYDDARPQRSQLAVSSRGLTASTIAGMRLQALRLVVLSACETNRAPSDAGAGFLGLTESFISAGAGGVIGSLWKVDDESTRKLMQSFYAALLRTRDPVLALRDAQRSMRNLPPTSWAAFRYAGK